MLELTVLRSHDILLQVASCSFDLHLWEISHALTLGATIVMLPPYSQMDLSTVIDFIRNHSVSFLLLTPTYTTSLQQFYETMSIHDSAFRTVTHLCNAGKKFLFETFVVQNIRYRIRDFSTESFLRNSKRYRSSRFSVPKVVILTDN